MEKVIVTVETLVDNHACQKLSNSEWLAYPKFNLTEKINYLVKLGVMSDVKATSNKLNEEFSKCHV